ncbi:hypothetical protein JXL21_07735 [Candidatus Bathyarchaeota archaeon]|nr:hypothetical protein [Candidatus Bathyarchaeota archaeon]
MDGSLQLFFRLLNGSVTVLIALLLYRIYRRKNHRFYLIWGFGFVSYGLSILIRLFSPQEVEVTPLLILAFVFVYSGYMMMLLGIGELAQQSRRLTLALLLFPLALAMPYFMGVDVLYVVSVFTLFPYLLIGVILTAIQFRHKLDLTLLISGWFLILLVNIGYVFGKADPGYIDLMSTFGKVVVYWGMASTRFSFLDEELTEFLLSGIPMEYPNSFTGKLVLLNMNKADRKRDIAWIERRVIDNAKKGVRTILLVYYDLITPQEVITEETASHLYVVRVIPGKREFGKTFSQHITSINDDINDVETLFLDIISFSNEGKVPCELIMYSLSHMIHTHGWKRVYSFLTSKNSLIKSSRVQLIGVYYPETHTDRSEIAKFERLADIVTSG